VAGRNPNRKSSRRHTKSGLSARERHQQNRNRAASAYNEYGYSDRSELASSYRYDSTTFEEIPAERRLYDYDNIGNRKTHTDGAATPPGVTYTSNGLNQYTMTRGFVESFAYDLDGNMTKSGLAAGDYDDDGDVDSADFMVFQGCYNGPNNPPQHAGCEESDIDGDGDVDSADFTLFQGCYNGANRPPACNANVRPTQYTYDGKNRLTAVEPIIPAATDKKATFGHDYLGRRVQRQVFGRNANNAAWLTTAESDQRFVYNQWNVVMVVNSSGTPQKKYTWGLDLSGLQRAAGFTPAGMDSAQGIHGAGGGGGILSSAEPAGPRPSRLAFRA
jgi:hypothetical protein